MPTKTRTQKIKGTFKSCFILLLIACTTYTLSAPQTVNAQNIFFTLYPLVRTPASGTLTYTVNNNGTVDFTATSNNGGYMMFINPTTVPTALGYFRSPIQITYEISSISGTTWLRLTRDINAGLATGATDTVLAVTTSTTTSLTHTTPEATNALFGVTFRCSTTCSFTGTLHQVVDADGNVIFPTSNANEVDVNVTIPDTIDFQTDAINFSMGMMIFLMSIQTWYIMVRRN